MMISDVELENYTSYTDAEQFYMDLYKEMKIVVHCSNCGRLHIFYDGFDKAQVIYKLEVENNS
ncbi:hypothetical protein C4F49_12700 [Sphingobacterium sp. KB22]|uniref:Uncharacterized protein n=2 Tax=Sphingobacterium hungaricum TaxID=2082723 RepID=A0A928UWD9_9SPHI|nr:hypothetical protein [Sphingobacterium hungaricum]